MRRKKRAAREPIQVPPGYSVRRKGGGSEYHLIPNADKTPHAAYVFCPCGPRMDYAGYVWVHHYRTAARQKVMEI